MDAIELGRHVQAFVDKWAPNDPSRPTAKDLFWQDLRTLLDQASVFSVKIKLRPKDEPDRSGENEGMVQGLLAAARKHGLQPEREGAFLLWVGNEVFQGREVQNFVVLTARARELYLMFRNQDHVSNKR